MEYDVLKDLSLRCNSCKNYIALPSVLEHRRHHQAMRIMRFKEGRGPRNVDSLSKRHIMLSQKVLAKCKENPSDPTLMRRIEKINEAYETLRFEYTKDDITVRAMLKQDGMTSMRDGYFEPRDKIEDDDITTKNMVSDFSQFPDCVYGIGQSQAMNKDWRDVMEDATAISTGSLKIGTHSKSEKNEVCYIGMFDGHHGSNAAVSSSEKLHEFVFDELSSPQTGNKYNGSGDDLYKENSTFLSVESEDTDDLSSLKPMTDSLVAKCLSKSFKKMDTFLGFGINEKSRVRWSGCSALICLITDDECAKHNVTEKGDSSSDNGSSSQSRSESVLIKNIGKVFVSNAGNVRAVMYQKRKPFVLSQSHDLTNSKEKKRVEDAGGIINSSEQYPRVNGVIGTTRGLGNHGDPELKKCISFSPHNIVAKIRNNTEMLVIATNSLWKVLSPSDVFTVLLHSIPHDAVTALRTGPTPIIPVIHGKRGDTSDTHQASTLPSIVETEEEDEIEEVIFVEAQDSDSDDDIIKEEVSKVESEVGTAVYSSDNSATNDRSLFDPNSMTKSTSMTGDAGLREKGDVVRDIREENARIAPLLSEQLVRAAILAGAVENVSAVVVLFKGMFQ